MKTKTLFYMVLTAVTMTLAACSQDDELQNDAPKPAAIEFEIFDGGYADVQTRTVEDGYRTKFVAGDVCGLYAYSNWDGNVCKNVKLTAEEGDDGKIIWKADNTSLQLISWDKYFIYYPYRENISNINIENGYTDTDVFANLISSWTPEKDQSTYANYTASDLMTAEGTATKLEDGRLKISFSMTHHMALAVIELPKTVYKFTDTSIPDYVVPTSVDFTSDIKPLRMADGTYRCIVKPNAKRPAVLLTSIMGYVSDVKGFTIVPSEMPAGKYTKFRIGGGAEGAPVEKSYTLQVGDYLLKDGTLVGKNSLSDAQKAKVVAVVFSAGHNQYDNSDYSKTGIGSEKCHGYAVAMTDASGTFKWGPESDTPLGCYPEGGNSVNAEKDWSGYDYTWNKIITAAGGIGGLIDVNNGYDATYQAVTYYISYVPSNCSGWFLPSVGQLTEVCSQSTTLFNDVGQGLRKEAYWSSSEYSTEIGSAIKVKKGGTMLHAKKQECNRVRAVLAF